CGSSSEAEHERFWFPSVAARMRPPARCHPADARHGAARLREHASALDRRPGEGTRVARRLLGGCPSLVGDEIAFEQYPGLLRGPEGTLASRTGNALDHGFAALTDRA